MITNKLQTGNGPLLAKNVVLPIGKVSNGVYQLFSSDSLLPIELEWNEHAVPQGYGRYVGDDFLFRRVDCVWISIKDPEVAKAVNKAIKSFCNGNPMTFGELAAGCKSETPLKVAYVTKILGKHNFPLKDEDDKRYKITRGWIKRVLDFNAYYCGLSLLEKYQAKSYCSLPTYWYDKTLVPGKYVTKNDDTIQSAGSPIEDPLVLDFLENYSGMKVIDLVQELPLEELKIVCLLVGARIFDFATDGFNQTEEQITEKKTVFVT